MLNVRDGSTSTQQAGGKRLSQIMARNAGRYAQVLPAGGGLKARVMSLHPTSFAVTYKPHVDWCKKGHLFFIYSMLDLRHGDILNGRAKASRQ